MPAPTFPSAMFDCNNAQRSISAEVSTLTQGSTTPFCGPLDNGHDGFAIQSAGGKLAVFQYHRVDKDAEGDVQFWEFIPTTDTLRTSPRLTGYVVTVFND